MGELALVTGTAARDTARDDLAALGDEVPQPADVLVVDEIELVRAELADLAPSEAAAFRGLRGRGNGWVLLLGRESRISIVGRLREQDV
jgi:hypothetical protein